jgi:hypothetical protein
MRARLPAAACCLLGGLISAMTLIRVVLVPWWQGLSPSEFRAWFRSNGKRIGAVMIPLGVSSAVAVTGACVLDRQRGSKFAAIATVGVVGITVAVNEPLNERFWSDEPMTDRETTEALERWVRWHDVRVALGLVAVAAATRRLTRSTPTYRATAP